VDGHPIAFGVVVVAWPEASLAAMAVGFAVYATASSRSRVCSDRAGRGRSSRRGSWVSRSAFSHGVALIAAAGRRVGR
jgi:hypothetical protein